MSKGFGDKALFLRKTERILTLLSLIYTLLLFFIGAWWLFLLNSESTKQTLSHTLFGADKNLGRMFFWEGGTFLVLLILLTTTLLIFYYKDLKKNRAMAIFFSSLTHELKTPLASIRLQSDVMNDLLKKSGNSPLFKLSERMIEDTQKLEIQMDKILQLSKIELGSELEPGPIDLKKFVMQFLKKWGPHHQFEFKFPKKDLMVLADELALELILKNLLENSKRHADGKIIQIVINESEKNVHFIYADGGIFKGEKNKLGTLFYKYNSKKGQGIGLYLIKKLMNKMDGKTIFNTVPELSINLCFKKATT